MDFAMDIDIPFQAYHASQVVQAQPSSISVIPDEVLLDILDMVMSMGGAQTHTLAVLLSHVSQLWRALTVCSPKFWTNVCIHETSGQPVTHFTSTLARVHQFLQRSGKQPLTVDITVFSQMNASERLTMNPAICESFEIFRRCLKTLSNILTPHVERFKSFNLTCDEFRSIVHIQGGFPHVPMPLLEFWHVRQTAEELAFEGDLEDVNDMTALHIPLRTQETVEEGASSMFPRLRSAIFYATPMDWSRFCPKNLRFLEIGLLPAQARPSGDVLRQILLANEHSLESLKICGAAPTSNASHPYVLSKLQRLEIGYAFADELIPLVEDLQVPNLVHLVIEDLYRSSTPHCARQQLEYDHTTTLLFQSITEHFPLHQVKDLELLHICLLPPLSQTTPTNAPIVLVPDFCDLVIPFIPLEFFGQLVTLKNLTLVNPDIAVLFTLNHIPIISEAGIANDVHDAPIVPAPALEFLRLEDFDQDLLRLFLILRISYHTSFRCLSKLTFCDPYSCWDTPANWVENVGRSPDMGFLAKNVEFVKTDNGSNVDLKLASQVYP
jgi:hypothetical protein